MRKLFRSRSVIAWCWKIFAVTLHDSHPWNQIHRFAGYTAFHRYLSTTALYGCVVVEKSEIIEYSILSEMCLGL